MAKVYHGTECAPATPGSTRKRNANSLAVEMMAPAGAVASAQTACAYVMQTTTVWTALVTFVKQRRPCEQG